MAIQAQMPDGTTLQFPDGTPDAVVNGAVKQHISQQPSDASQTPEAKMGLTPAPPEQPPPPTIGDITASPQGTDTPAWMSQPLPSARDVLAPAPNTTYGDVVPVARDDKTGALRPALPNIIRAPLLGLTSEGPQYDSKAGFTVPGATINPDTGTLGVTPEAASVAPFAAFPLGFSGQNALLRDPVSPMTLTKPPPVTLPELNAAIVRADEQPPRNQLGPDAAPGPQTPPNQLGPAPPGVGAGGTTGLAGLGGAAQAIGGNLRDMLWDKLQRGDTTELGQPSRILTDAKAAMDQGVIKNRADFDAWSQQWAGGQRQGASGSTISSPTAAQPAAAAPTPAPAPAAPMTADEILARSKGYYSPADQQAAQGAMINPAPSNAIRSILTDAVPTDPQTAIAKGSTPLIQLGKDYAAFQDQPMSFDTVMQLDRRLTAEKQTAMRSGDNDLARQIGEAQDQVRDRMSSLGDGDTTGDPSTLANLAQARQAYAQYIKESQLDDIRYGASLPGVNADAYVRTRGNALLRSPQSRNWTDDERAALTDAIQQGVRGFIGNAAISIIKPLATAAGFKAAGPGGAWLGSTLGEAGQSAVRDALARRRPDRLGPVSGVITQGVPPPNVLGPQAAPAAAVLPVPPRVPVTPAAPGAPLDPAVLAQLQASLLRTNISQAER